LRYIKARGIEEQEILYFEVDVNRTAYRQVYVTENRSFVSIAPDFYLSDQEVEMYDGDVEITEEAFEKIWKEATGLYRAAWEHVKGTYSLQDSVVGTIRMFYPQGVLIQLSEEGYAVADYDKLRQNTNPAHMYPGYQVQGTIKQYDELNFWLLLEDCVVLVDQS